MNLQKAMKSLTCPKSLINRTQPKDLIDNYVAKTFDGFMLCLDVYERKDDKWFVILTHAFAGWTQDDRVAFGIKNAAQYYKLGELKEML
jgi:hypothetical protein